MARRKKVKVKAKARMRSKRKIHNTVAEKAIIVKTQIKSKI